MVVACYREVTPESGLIWKPSLYGYWIMSRDFDDLKTIVASAVFPCSFETVDVARRVADYERGSKGSKI